MPVLDVVNHQNERVGEVALDEEIFDGRVREHLIHEVVVMQLAGRRAGTASAKTRSEDDNPGLHLAITHWLSLPSPELPGTNIEENGFASRRARTRF